MKMQIKRVYLISDEEMLELVRNIEYSINRISVNDTYTAIWTLTRIKDELNENLKERKL